MADIFQSLSHVTLRVLECPVYSICHVIELDSTILLEPQNFFELSLYCGFPFNQSINPVDALL